MASRHTHTTGLAGPSLAPWRISAPVRARPGQPPPRLMLFCRELRNKMLKMSSVLKTGTNAVATCNNRGLHGILNLAPQFASELPGRLIRTAEAPHQIVSRRTWPAGVANRVCNHG